MPIGKPNCGRAGRDPRPNGYHCLRNLHRLSKQFDLPIRITTAQAPCPDQLFDRLSGALQNQDVTFPDYLPSRRTTKPNMVADEPGNHDIVFLRKRKRLVQRRSNQFAVLRHRRL